MDSFKRLMVVVLFVLLTNTCKALTGDRSRESCCSVCQCSTKNFKRPNETVNCSERNLTEVPRCQWPPYMKTLKLHGNRIKNITKEDFQKFRRIYNLDLSANELSYLPDPNVTMQNLRDLDLNLNYFTAIPTAALSRMPKLKKLELSDNLIERIEENAFRNQGKLEDLELRENPALNFIHENFFSGRGGKLVHLNLEHTNLTSIPFQSIRKMKNLETLDLSSLYLREIPDLAFEGLNNLEYIRLVTGEHVTKIGTRAFSFLPVLKKLSLINSHLSHFPNLTGTHSLEIIELPINQIEEIPEDLCHNQKFLEDINLSHNKLTRLPSLGNCSSLLLVKMDFNKIESFENTFQGLTRLKDITAKGNKVKSLGEKDFYGLKELEYLYLQDNEITKIHENAFSSFTQLQRINLENSKFPALPTKGLETIHFLSIKGNTVLTRFPSPSHFPKIRHLVLEYPYHCCFFLHKKKLEDDMHVIDNGEQVTFTWLNGNKSDFFSGEGSGTAEDTSDDEPTSSPKAEFIQAERATSESDMITCSPQPDPFFPCDDLMGDWVLRCGVWIVFLLALTGNATVIIVILASHTKMDVSRFLISNLAFADLFMGIYLGFLAVVDVSTFGKFKKYALDWQMGPGCQTAGFLAVLSSELSVFTLTVITLERYIAIKNAIRVNRKLELKTAVIVMAIGWVFAITTASLPLLKINDYGKFSVCLPFEIENTKSIIFLVFLLCLNATAFVIILCCYILMYCSIRGSNAWNASDVDFRVAKRMALLVFTDFACWAPIVFLSLTAAFGSTMVTLSQAKIITIFVFPLNSCANPFLYAIFTSHFKKDLVAICRRVEDKYPFLKITKHKTSFSRRSSYSGAVSENPNIYLRVRRFSLPLFMRGLHNSVTTHDKAGSSASSNSNNKSTETNALVQQHQNGILLEEKETSV